MNRVATFVAAALTALKLSGMSNKNAISKNYTVDDVTHSETAESLGITEQNDLPDAAKRNARYLALKVIEPANKFTGTRATPRSWWRSKRLNDALPNASPTSVHKTGRAVDLELWIPDHETGVLTERNDLLARALVSGRKFDRMIVYGSLTKPRFLHVEVPEIGKDPRNIVLHRNEANGFTSLNIEDAAMLYG